MNRSKFFIGLSVLLVAAIGAFASSANFRANTYYYISGNTCLPKVVEYACVDASPNTCIETGFGVLHQTRIPIPGTNPVRYTCDIPLQKQ